MSGMAREPYREAGPPVAERSHCLYCGRPRSSDASACLACGAEPPVVPCSGCGRPVPAPREVCACGVACPAWTHGGDVHLACPRCGGTSLGRVALDVTTVHVEQCARCLGS